MMLFDRDSAIQSASRRFYTVYKSEIRFLASHLDDVTCRPDAQLSKASSVWTTRTFRPDLPQCREVSYCSSLHPSERFSSTSRRHSVFDQVRDFLSKHSYGKIAATIQTMWIPVRTRTSIRQVSHSKSRRLDVNPFAPDARASDMEIACIRSTVWTTIPLVRTCEALVWEVLVAEVQPPEDRAPPSGRGSNQERISAKFLESRSHSCSSGRRMIIVWTTPRF
jgi:hypothetical protein